jgi:hypothetical protein
METLRRFNAIVLADLRERTRALRFWVILAVMAALTWTCFPARESGNIAVSIDEARGLYSSAWSGLTLGLMYSSMLAWLGFYLVRGTLVRDFDSRVWQLLVATPMTRAGYLVAKWASHMVVFGVVLVVGLAVGVAAQWVRAEDRSFDLVELVKPSLLLALPALSITAFFAIAFDMVPFLRRTAGNVLYFFVWLLLFTGSLHSLDPAASEWARQTWLSDPSGLSLVQRHLMQVLPVIAPGLDASNISIGMNTLDGPMRVFAWTQWSVGAADLGGRGLWVAVSLLATALLAPFLDLAARYTSATKASANAGRRLRWLDVVLRPIGRGAAGVLVASELRLVLRGRPLWWWAVILVCGVVQLAAPVEGMASAVIVAWMVSLDVFGRSLLRERDTRTADLVMTAPKAAGRLLRARIVVALVLAVAPAMPALLRLAAQTPAMALSLLATAAVVALSGLALAALCRSPRPYELAMVFAAYVGVQGGGPLAFQARSAAMLPTIAAVAGACAVVLVLAWPSLNRRRAGGLASWFAARVAQTGQPRLAG